MLSKQRALEEYDNKYESHRRINEEIIKEALLMNLRTFKGIDLKEFNKKYGFNLTSGINIKQIPQMEKEGFITFTEDSLTLTPKGMNIATTISQKLALNQ